MGSPIHWIYRKEKQRGGGVEGSFGRQLTTNEHSSPMSGGIVEKIGEFEANMADLK